MNINGRFTRVSKTYYKDGVVLVGLLGGVFPHDLTEENINYIKSFYMLSGCNHALHADWPDGIEPAYPAAKANFINGFILLYKQYPEETEGR